ncbi:MAG: SIMPL domain-containing protein [Chloroflexi bacterium]|nr:SIMPL domain-containing protein [Anaerolineaceae bacterium]NMB89702.1 SIMPL domain-containing protein [Chloroflexota bacterium]
MKPKFLLIPALTILLALSACATPAAAGGAATPATRQIIASGSGQVFLSPDIAYVYVGVHSQADNVSDALADNNDQAQQISQALLDLGVEQKDIQTSAFNVYPQQEYGPTGEITNTSYAVDNTVFVTVRDLSNLGSLLDTVVRTGANSINGVSFDVTDKSEAVREARRMAIEDAKANATDIAEAAGVELVEITNVNVYSNNTGTPYYEGKGGVAYNAAASQVPVASGQLSLVVNADVTYSIR